jgi:poly(3-hydroxybutyrate) depolymerase
LFSNPSWPEHVSAQKTATDWAAALGCRSSATAGTPIDVEARLPGAETRVERYESCKNGALELWTVAGGGHEIGFSEPAPTAVWAFLQR